MLKGKHQSNILSQPSANKKKDSLYAEYTIDYTNDNSDTVPLPIRNDSNISDEINSFFSHNISSAIEIDSHSSPNHNAFHKTLGYKKHDQRSNIKSSTSIAGLDADEYEDDIQITDKIGAESYFETFHKSTRSKKKGSMATSNNTLALLSQLDSIELKVHSKKKKATPAVPDTLSFFDLHADQINELTSFYKTQYPQWLFELHNGYNLLFYGYGSKRELVLDFCESMILDQFNPVVVINGFNPNLNFKSVLENIALNLLKLNKQSAKLGSIADATNEIIFYFKSTAKDQNSANSPHLPPSSNSIETLTLLINNIDGTSLRKENIQQCISSLASIAGISIVATTDHINAPLLFDSKKLFFNGFDFVYHNLTSFANYANETSFENYQILFQHSNLSQNSKFGSLSTQFSSSAGAFSFGSGTNNSINLASVVHVMASLTSNAKNIFYKLAQYQIDSMPQHQKSSAKTRNKPASTKHDPKLISSLSTDAFPPNFDPSLGMEYFALYNTCKESFLVSNEVTFRSLLTEFKDHKIIVSYNDSSDGSQLLFIPLPKNDLVTLISQS
ncbi:Origin of replication complex subunit 2 [Smittium culicis]|uniref:Origin recognition complex subunit 2 n=1 Tax=Smittium culicis TaxID=133412 RepID=A0A1R1YSQ4_9FUNG|nr:Origin of replication complex subunit 2 [Smittium culicis]